MKKIKKGIMGESVKRKGSGGTPLTIPLFFTSEGWNRKRESSDV